jgi:tetratricopeptide (TPR) repeat protein
MMKNYLKAQALAAVRNGDIPLGISKYLEYLALDPNQGDDDAWAGLGGAYKRIADIDNALANYRKAYDINPGSTYALVNLVSLHAARNTPDDQTQLRTDVPEAIRLSTEVIEAGNASFWTWYDLGTLHLINGNANEAAKTFYHAVALTPATAKENFRSVLTNLLFLQEHNPSIDGLADAITLIKHHIE